MWSAINLRLSVLLARDLKGGGATSVKALASNITTNPKGTGLVVYENTDNI